MDIQNEAKPAVEYGKKDFIPNVAKKPSEKKIKPKSNIFYNVFCVIASICILAFIGYSLVKGFLSLLLYNTNF